MQTTNIVDENIKRIGELFPNCLTERLNDEGKPEVAIDFDQLRQELSKDIVEGPEERYQFTWPDKRNAIRLANAPTTDTLRPCREESVDFDNTQNLYIEGDNLQVLKLLRENYLGKVKMIYIDPPYNTGNDFVYNDYFGMDTSEWSDSSGDYDEEGHWLTDKYTINSESNGRFHTDWLNMIYPRLKVAKDLLSEDGVIFISIDDNEVENLRKVCDEVFGADNYINIISVNMKNIAGASGGGEDKRLKKNCEFCIVYSRNYQSLNPFSGVYEYTEMHEILNQYRVEGKSWHYNSVLFHAGDKEYAASTQDGEGNEIKIFRRPTAIIKSIKQIMAEENLSEKDVFNKYGNSIFEAKDAQSSIRGRIMKAKKSNNITDDVVSIEYIPRTGKNKGCIYEQFYKGEKCRLFAWLKDISVVIDGILYKKDAQGTYWDLTQFINNLSKEGDVAFPNGKKPVAMIERMLNMVAQPDSIILDFFSGSATTAHAVMQLNAEDGGNRRFIMVQLPEATDEKSEAYKAGYKNICEIGKERIRRAGKKIKEESPLTTQDLDIGFRVLKLDSSNMQDVYYTPSEFDEQKLFDDNIKSDRTEEDLLFQTMIELGIELSAKIEKRSIAGKTVWSVSDGYLMACFDEEVNETTITEIARQQPYYFVMRDSSLANDQVADNFEQIWEEYSKDTVRRII